MSLNSKVVSATWQPDEGTYKILLENPQTGEQWEDWSHVLVNATGNLNKWKCRSSIYFGKSMNADLTTVIRA